MRIKDIRSREILDSRGNPTVETDVILENGLVGRASVPSGASTGSKEALELRDNDPHRYMGLGVLAAVNNVNTIIRNRLIGEELNQTKIDKILLELDGTKNKSNLGANAILSVSLASLKAAALSANKELFEYVSAGKASLPIPMMNIVNGGAHADSSLEIQEFMIVPVVKTFKERLRAGSEVFHTLKKILKNQGAITSVGDEGGFAPRLKSNIEALDLIVKAINMAGYTPGKDVFIALDVAASEIYDATSKTYSIDHKKLTTTELISYYQDLIKQYPIISIEDPFYEADFESFSILTNMLKNNILLVGDDFFVTNKEILQQGINCGAGNAILLKVNQIGTVSEMIDTIMLARQNNYQQIISHRSGETEDTFIAHLAVGLNIPYIKTGSLSRTDRICKYNELLRIEEKLTMR